LVIDHKSYAISETEGDHTLIAADDYIESDVLLGKKKIEVSLFDLFIRYVNSLGGLRFLWNLD
jgi:oligosaccharyltransferase complex subunit beta